MLDVYGFAMKAPPFIILLFVDELAIAINNSLEESFKLQMGFSFPFLRANDLCLSLLYIRARNFFSLVRRGYIRKVSVQLVPKYFSRDCSTDSISCSERKKWKKKILKQGSKSRK